MPDMLKSMQNVWGWLFLADYDAAKEQAVRDIISRCSHGNVNFQNGLSMDEAELDRLSMAGDKAGERLNKLVSAT